MTHKYLVEYRLDLVQGLPGFVNPKTEWVHVTNDHPNGATPDEIVKALGVALYGYDANTTFALQPNQYLAMQTSKGGPYVEVAGRVRDGVWLYIKTRNGTV